MKGRQQEPQKKERQATRTSSKKSLVLGTACDQIIDFVPMQIFLSLVLGSHLIDVGEKRHSRLLLTTLAVYSKADAK
jgi:hypothetical protein